MRGHRMKKGFTLAELLIVVGIIAVLVAVAIPIFKGKLDKAKEATCKANRRSLYGQVVNEGILSDRPFSELFDEFVAHAGKCPCGGTFSWEDQGNTGVINCSYHDGTGGSEGNSEGGSGSDSGGGSGSSVPALHGAGHNIDGTTFCNQGVVLQDGTGTYVLALSGTWPMWQQYSEGKTAAELAQLYPDTVKPVNASNIKDYSSINTVTAGDIFYHSGNGNYYYVNTVNQYELKDYIDANYFVTAPDMKPNGSWVLLIQ